MEKLLRSCYKEGNIVGTNAIIYDKRRKSIDNIIENDLLEDHEWNILLKWAMGIDCNQIDDILIKIEELFCQEDSSFSKDSNKEIKILLVVMIYHYCISNDNVKIPLFILCGYNIGYKISSSILYQLFCKLLDQKRVEERKNLFGKVTINTSKLTKLKKTINDEKKALEENEEFNYTTQSFDCIMEILEIYEKNFSALKQREEYFIKELKAQREESDVLWWMTNGWCDIYKMQFKDMSNAEIVLIAPIELRKLVRFSLGPYSANQVLNKIVSFSQSVEQQLTLSQVISSVRESLFDILHLDKVELEIVQPILFALKCKFETQKGNNPEMWKTFYENKFGSKPDEIQMNVSEFSYQLFLELELANLSLE